MTSLYGTAYQDGVSVEIFNTQGKDPLKKWKAKKVWMDFMF